MTDPDDHARSDADPIAEARRQWLAHGWVDAADGMALVTGITRVHQIFTRRVDEVLRPMDLTFARYELLQLLSFTRSGHMSMKSIGALLQVHATSVTSAVDRLEKQEFVRRRSNEADARSVRVQLLPAGREIVSRATVQLNERVFTDPGISRTQMATLDRILTALRSAAGDF